MKAFSAFGFLATLAVLVLCWWLYQVQPELLIGTPWGLVHVSYVLAGVYALAMLWMGLFLVGLWLNLHGLVYKKLQEIKTLKQVGLQAEPNAVRDNTPNDGTL